MGRIACAVDLFVAGVGGVGEAFLRQLERAVPVVAHEQGVLLRLTGVANSRRGVIEPGGIPRGSWRERLQEADEESARIVEAACTPGGSEAELRILVDCTASPDVAAVHGRVLRSGGGVVTANKIPLVGPRSEYRKLMADGRGRYRYETTVGAALPVLRLVRDLISTGDRVRSVDAVLSGTLAYVCARVMDGATLRTALSDAACAGYTEPDPRMDLSGLDVARKAVILAREAGWSVELTDVEAAPLVPDELLDGSRSVASFLDALAEVTDLERIAAQARERGRWLAYIARLEGERVRVGLETLDAAHPSHGLAGTDNVIAITSERYPTPIVVRGAGAGREVTAGGVLADVLSLIPVWGVDGARGRTHSCSP